MPDTARTPVNTRQVATDTAHRTHKTRAPVHKREEAPDTARAYAPRAAEGQGTTNHTPKVGCYNNNMLGLGSFRCVFKTLFLVLHFKITLF